MERRYGPRGQFSENEQHCIEEVWPDARHPHQCSRRRGHGQWGLFCRQHAKRHPAVVIPPSDLDSDASS